MILGLMAGELLRGDAVGAGGSCWLLLGGGRRCAWRSALALHFGGVCPIVKRIWTPSFALVSGGMCLLTLWRCSTRSSTCAGWRRWAFPAVVVGQNSIAAYVMIHLIARWIRRQRCTATSACGVFAVVRRRSISRCWRISPSARCVWLICYWMYRRQIFLRI